MVAGVGADWETRIITGHEAGTLVPDKIDSLVERGWVEHELHPFAVKGLEKDERPPRDWKGRLRSYAASIVPPEIDGDKKKKKKV
jgi:hypothetical protein